MVKRATHNRLSLSSILSAPIQVIINDLQTLLKTQTAIQSLEKHQFYKLTKLCLVNFMTLYSDFLT